MGPFSNEEKFVSGMTTWRKRMSSRFRRRCYGAGAVIGLAFALSIPSLNAEPPEFARPVTVADTITMTELVGQGPGLHDFMQLSPDGKHFEVTVERGDVKQNERVFSLLVFCSAEVFSRPADTVAVLASSANEDGIADVRWLDDDTLTFLGTNRKGPTQVFAVDIRSKRLRQLTNHPTKINAYAVAPGLERVLYTADADLTAENQRLREHGFVVDDQSLIDIIMGHLESHRLAWRDLSYELPQETFIKQESSGRVIRLSREDGTLVVVPNGLFPYSRNAVSPDGRFAIAEALMPARDTWRSFGNPFPSMVDGTSDVTTFVLVDLTSGDSSPLVDAPSSPYLTSIAWAPDSRSAVLVNTFLPLDSGTSEGGASRLKQTVVAEVNLATRRLTPIHGPALDASVAQGVVCAQAIDWKPVANLLVLAISRVPDNRGGVCESDTAATYQKTALGWTEKEVRDADSLRSTPDGSITISVNQGLNTPLDLKAVDHQTGRTRIFTDFNPQFRRLRFAPVTLITWTASDGTRWSGDLYLPPEHKPNSRYPLVIQTHGCTTDKFDVTGFGSGGATGYAAQVLANKGIAVLQEGHCANLHDGPPFPGPHYSANGAEHEVLGYESAVDLLDKEGIIDRNHVGLQGHSATAWTVIYAVAHPKPALRYAAALSTARGDLGYLAFLATTYGRFWSAEGNGGLPIGDNFENFRQNALPFNLERVATPILSQEPDGLRYVPLMWEIHEVLKMLGKPEEFLIFPDGTHNLVKPWERLASQQAAVDWFCFWLKDEEDPDPAKRGQYARWRALRKLQLENAAKAKTNNEEPAP
jgi:dipeptidyl aminopeptidase/acylaminoacyl peptidase